MTKTTEYRFKVADQDDEFEQIFKLNYKTFVEEIPQHERREDEKLVDRFHEHNTYFIAKVDDDVVGMVSICGERPFSLDQKLPDLDGYLGAGRRPVEVRLLAVENGHRGTKVLFGLLKLAFQNARAEGYDMAIISGTTRQLRLYKRLGFKPFGPMLGEGEAKFQPMQLRIEQVQEQMHTFARILPPQFLATMQCNLLPGPVTLAENVRDAFSQIPISHRGDRFIEDFNQLREDLAEHVGAQHASLFLGSGTLGNDIVAAQLKREGGRGVILNNGEFGNRLVDHARRMGLDFDVIQKPWGEMFTEADLQAHDFSDIGWLWCVHCETSTGMLQDLEMIKRVLKPKDVELCVDAISSVGAVDVDLSGVKFATSTSGKALQSFSGISIVFHEKFVTPDERIPRYLDLGKYLASGGIAFTQSSNLIYALKTALDNIKADKERLSKRHALSRWLREQLAERGLNILLGEDVSNPLVLTLPIPQNISSVEVAKNLERAGFLVSAHSGYLVEKNWIQLCLMGELKQGDIAPILTVLTQSIFGDSVPVAVRAA